LEPRPHGLLSAGSHDELPSTQVIHHARLAESGHTVADLGRVLRVGGSALVSLSGRKHDNETCQEIEPGTFVPLSGPEAGLPHHIFTVAEVKWELRLARWKACGA